MGESVTLWEWKALVEGLGEMQGTVLDIGACRGDYTVVVPERFKVVAFEPEVERFGELEMKVLGSRRENTFLCRVAVAEKTGLAPLFYSPSRPQRSSLLFSSFLSRWQAVTTIALDESDLFRDRIVAAKIDVEGGEYGVLKGMQSILFISKPKLLIEFLPGFDQRSVELLRRVGYGFRSVGSNTWRYAPVPTEESYDFVCETGRM